MCAALRRLDANANSGRHTPGRTICQPPDCNDQLAGLRPTYSLSTKVWNFDFLAEVAIAWGIWIYFGYCSDYLMETTHHRHTYSNTLTGAH